MGNKDEMSDRSLHRPFLRATAPGGKDSAKDSAKNRGQQERDRMREERDEHEGNRGRLTWALRPEHAGLRA